MIIYSERLALIPMTPAFLRASLRRDRAAAEELIDVLLPEAWPMEEDILAVRLAELEADLALQPWLLRAMALRDSRRMVGYLGFHTAPGPEYLQPKAENSVEFGFEVFPADRRRGFGREASLALMEWATCIQQVNRFVLSIRPDNQASQALARSLGFVRIGSQLDKVDGVEEVWELRIH
jgi:[ribosomal protein S5]-alanine N-acetyltransferase